MKFSLPLFYIFAMLFHILLPLRFYIKSSCILLFLVYNSLYSYHFTLHYRIALVGYFLTTQFIIH